MPLPPRDERRTDARTLHLKCWFCSEPLDLADVIRDGILGARAERDGGPYRLYGCPACRRTNFCESSPRGRWFASPPFRPTLLDYLFGKVLGSAPEDFLQALSWYRAHEDRRRHFFEREGDRRYSGVFGKLRQAPAAAEGESRGRAAGASASGGSGEERSGSSGGRKRAGPAPGHPPPRVLTPWEVLGLRPGAPLEEIHRTFHRLAVRYHPDKVHHLGEDFRALAHRKFTELQRAYEELLRRSR